MNVGLRVQSTALSQLYRAAAGCQSGSSTTAFKLQKVLRRSRQLAKSCALAIHLLFNMQHRTARGQIDQYVRYIHTHTHTHTHKHESTGLLVTVRTPKARNSAL
jgi:poly(3-hydroxybutyrate) depolymerase